jgi:hypothetical protein
VRGFQLAIDGDVDFSAGKILLPLKANADQRLLRLMTKRVGVALRGQREKGVVRPGQRQYVLWAVVR